MESLALSEPINAVLIPKPPGVEFNLAGFSNGTELSSDAFVEDPISRVALNSFDECNSDVDYSVRLTKVSSPSCMFVSLTIILLNLVRKKSRSNNNLIAINNPNVNVGRGATTVSPNTYKSIIQIQLSDADCISSEHTVASNVNKKCSVITNAVHSLSHNLNTVFVKHFPLFPMIT